MIKFRRLLTFPSFYKNRAKSQTMLIPTIISTEVSEDYTVITGNVNRKTGKVHTLTAIPYYAWSNRGGGEMAVWLPQSE